ncbi:MAG: hypothetical protein IJT21_08060 [Synergistaceae bacterium]|nr:hypothetical protein [Synergistaceae bacterium]
MIQLVYCGPNWLKFGLQKYQVFINGFDFSTKEAIKICPEIENLFCPPDELDSFREKINTSGSREHRLYEIAQAKAGAK